MPLISNVLSLFFLFGRFLGHFITAAFTFSVQSDTSSVTEPLPRGLEAAIAAASGRGIVGLIQAVVCGAEEGQASGLQ